VGERLVLGPAWAEARTGIQERRVAGTHETVVDMATAAALAKLSADPRYQGDKARVDTVVVATSNAESTMPSVAAQVAARGA
jgi:3-oxoacyl-[acyl-carrier-protein] synthase III